MYTSMKIKQVLGLCFVFIILSFSGCLGDDLLEEPFITSIGFTANISAGQTKIPVDSPFAVNFNAKIDTTTVTPSSFYVVEDALDVVVSEVLDAQCLTGTALTGTITCGSDKLTCTLNLEANLAPSTSYLLCLKDTIKTADPASGTFVADSIGFRTIGSFLVGGTLVGLTTGSVVIQNNGGDDLTLSTDGTFSLETPVAEGALYEVTVLAQPDGLTCSVGNGSGTVEGVISDVAITCAVNTYAVGGTLTGLSGRVVIQNNRGDDLTLTTNGTFTFLTNVADGGLYDVTVLTQPTGQICTITNGSGSIGGSAISDVDVTCSVETAIVASTYSLGGILTGLIGTVVIQNNGGDNLVLTANGPFTFTTKLLSAATYAVTVLTHPSQMECLITGGSSGSVASANISTVSITCSQSVLIVSTNGGAGISTDLGQAFDTLSTNDGLSSNVINSVSGTSDLSVMFAATEDEGIDKIEDNGDTITNIKTVTVITFPTNIKVNSVFVRTVSNNIMVFAGTDNGLAISTNGGNSFGVVSLNDPAPFPSNEVQTVFASEDGTRIYVGTNAGFVVSLDSGLNWTLYNTGNSNLGNNSINGVFASEDGTKIYVATENGLAISTDAGIIFTNVITGLGNAIVSDVYANSDGTKIYAATDGGLSISTDSGATFSNRSFDVGLGTDLNPVATSVAVNKDGSRIYVGTDSGLAISNDSGASFFTTRNLQNSGLGSNLNGGGPEEAVTSVRIL
jgi:hypothetical protein